MKYIKNLNSLNSLILVICLVVCIATLVGCSSTQTEAKAERARRWELVTRSNLSQIPDDIDAILLMDKRSKLTDDFIRD